MDRDGVFERISPTLNIYYMYLRSRFSAAFVPKPPDLATAGLSGRFSGAAIRFVSTSTISSCPHKEQGNTTLSSCTVVQAAFKILIVAS
ncbi:hypothetical protein PCANC_25991 [Puccinia coronata f. sp. avenae]|uniref:Uncharacterized protein n=1 Tax=Puccinia coronata f. sp. avenae TaxID=200324 RepID=A0A2N5S759_9BASI|nr:hypothetical protein PCANC_25991 [Puccinia coronata f. sp. avenae]